MEIIQLLRDLAIIILALVWIVVGIASGIMIWFLWRGIGALRSRAETLSGTAGEVLRTAQSAAAEVGQGARSIRASADLVSERVVEPVITISAAVAGATRFVEAYFRPRRNGTAESEDQ